MDFFTDANRTLYWKCFFKKIAPQKSAILIVLFPVSPKQCSNPLSVESRNVLPLDEFRAFGLAGIGVGAAAKAQLVHLADHFVTRSAASIWPCGNKAKWLTLAPTNSIALAFLQAATQAPQPMQDAASMAMSALCFGIGIVLASGTPPVVVLM